MEITSLKQLLPKYNIEIYNTPNRWVRLEIDGNCRFYDYKYVNDNINKIKNIHDYRENIYEFLKLNKFIFLEPSSFKYVDDDKYIVIDIDFVYCYFNICGNKLLDYSYSLSADELFTKVKTLLDIESFNKCAQEQ